MDPAGAGRFPGRAAWRVRRRHHDVAPWLPGARHRLPGRRAASRRGGLLRRGLRRHRPGGRPPARRAGQHHARRAHRLRGRHRPGPDAGLRAPTGGRRPPRAERRLAAGPVPAGHARQRQARRHRRAGAHRPGHRAARPGLRHAGALPRAQRAARRRVPLRGPARRAGGLGRLPGAGMPGRPADPPPGVGRGARGPGAGRLPDQHRARQRGRRGRAGGGHPGRAHRRRRAGRVRRSRACPPACWATTGS